MTDTFDKLDQPEPTEYFNYLAYTFALLILHERGADVGDSMTSTEIVSDAINRSMELGTRWSDFPEALDRAYGALLHRYDAAALGVPLADARGELVTLVTSHYAMQFS